MKTKSILTNLLTVIMLITFLLFVNGSIHAQQDPQTTETTHTPQIFIGLGLGLNEYGLGGCMEIPIVDRLSIYGNAGLGGWGWKLGAGISFYPSKTPYKSSFGIGYASASGLKDFETELPVEPNDQNKKVTLDLNRVGTINLVYSYNFHLGRKSKFVLSTGYAIPVTNNAYELKSTGVILSETAKQALVIIQPGGLILGFKFLFGVD
ncbi:MAG: hypothetical protein K9H64_03710 [Bacteroidales bacterium]|nr:hypothetical protein [Bacteroidales bacterium]MCF8454940.1 hypothetical protein [Bacteroidales bacterium]